MDPTGPVRWVETVFAFACISLASAQIAPLFKKVKLPLITGYLTVGTLCGPYIIGMIRPSDVPNLKFISQIAGAYIAFSAGAEFYMDEVKDIIKTIGWMTGGVLGMTFLFCFVTVYALADTSLLGFAQAFPDQCQVGIALLAACICCLRSPAAAIAMAKEMKASGKVTKTMLGVTVGGDIITLAMFAVCTSIAITACDSNRSFAAIDIIILVIDIIVAFGLGAVYGHILTYLMNNYQGFKSARYPLHHLILPSGFLVFLFCDWFAKWSLARFGFSMSLEPMIICVVGAYKCTNNTDQRPKFMRLLGKANPWIFIPFFTLSGAGLDVSKMWQSVVFGIILFIIRTLSIIAGAAAGGKISKAEPAQMKFQWMTLVTQAGVSLGLAGAVNANFHEQFGPDFNTAMVSEILIANIVGPIWCRQAIQKSEEDGKADAPKPAVQPAATEPCTPAPGDAVAVEMNTDQQSVSSSRPSSIDFSSCKNILVMGADPVAHALVKRLSKQRGQFRVTVADPLAASAPSRQIVGWESLLRKDPHLKWTQIKTTAEGMSMKDLSESVVPSDMTYDAVVLMMDNDRANLEACKVIQERCPDALIFARVFGPALKSELESRGVIVLYPFSSFVRLVQTALRVASDPDNIPLDYFPNHSEGHGRHNLRDALREVLERDADIEPSYLLVPSDVYNSVQDHVWADDRPKVVEDSQQPEDQTAPPKAEAADPFGEDDRFGMDFFHNSTGNYFPVNNVHEDHTKLI